MSNDPIVIVEAKRTAIGEYLGMFQSVPAPELAATVIQNIMESTKIPAAEISEVILGCVLPAGIGQAPARQAAIKGGLPPSVGATTINKMCGSGMKAVMLAYDALLAAQSGVYLAGGMENMSRAPYIIDKARSGYRMGHGKLYDHMLLDGLEDSFAAGTLMGVFAEKCASQYHFSREAQDAFALNSLRNAQNAIQTGAFKTEIVPFPLKVKGEVRLLTTDELPQNARPEKIPQLKPAFDPKGTVTAANASGISDGASVILMMHESTAKNFSLTPKAKILGHASFAQSPEWFTTAPVGAMKQLLAKLQWTVAGVDLFEINEAFAVVTMAAMQELAIPAEKVNVRGGACALGHPVGATGARLITTLLHTLTQKQLKTGMASLCIGGGEAVAVAIELM